VFFGRTGVEACRFFNLNLADWRGASLLDCPGGPGSVAPLARGFGLEVLAVDPLYALETEALERRCREDIAFTMERLSQSSTVRTDFNLEQYHREKLGALQAFLADRQAQPESYIPGVLPELPLADRSFDLVLSGHLLFAYAPLADGGLYKMDCFDLAWHRRALAELLRVCRRELRIFPAHTITMPARVHPYVAPLLDGLPAGWEASLEPTSYDQGAAGETPMLRIRRVGPSPARPESGQPLPTQE
jgi:SAM-dependent methyltransferase